MQHLDEGTIHAWLDGALGADDAREVEAHVAVCGECAGRVAEARGFIAASSRILSALDHVPADVIPASERRVAAAAAPMIAAAEPRMAAAAAAPPPNDMAVVVPRARWGHRYARMAAVFAFVVVGTFVVARESGHDSSLNPAPIAVMQEQHRARADSPNAPGAAPAPAPQVAPAQPKAAPGAQRPRALGSEIRRAPPARTLAKPEAAAPPVAAAPDSAGANSDAAGNALQASRARAAGLAGATKVTKEGKGLRQLAEPRLVASDTVTRGAIVVRRETYLVGDNRVVLEARPPAAVPNGVSGGAAPAAPPPPAAQDSIAAADASPVVIRIIRWRGADGTDYTLSGPLSADSLQRIRAALGKG